MPNRRRFRGPRRPSAGAAEGPAGEGPVQPLARAEAPSEGAEGMRPAAARRRRRSRGGRGSRPEGAVGAAETAEAGPPGQHERAPGSEGGAESEARRRRRRRRGRSRGGAEPALAGEPDLDTAEGELPADYIPLPVERGMPLLYEPAQRTLAVADEEQEPSRAQKTKRVNAGKLFWYIRSKSYVPIPELRRRFEITPDEMATIQDDDGKLYVGLPQDVADVVANLRRQQKIGLECSVDFSTPIVIGVYPLFRS